MCDESSDISKTEQLSFSVRHCNENYNGASAMKRWAVLLKNEVFKHAFYIHCFAHCNELVFTDVTSLSRLIAHAQDFCENMYTLAGVSPKRVLLFQNIHKELAEENMDNGRDGGSSLKLKNLPRTRWTTRGAAADIILKRNVELQETLNTLSTDVSVTPECPGKSKGLL